MTNNVCVNCTFINNVSKNYCEMCNSPMEGCITKPNIDTSWHTISNKPPKSKSPKSIYDTPDKPIRSAQPITPRKPRNISFNSTDNMNVSPIKCSISLASVCHKRTREHDAVYHNVKEVSIINNQTLDGVMNRIKKPSKDLENKQFNLISDNSKYWFNVTYASDSRVALEQWCGHWDKTTNLIPVAVRQVVIEF